MNSFNRVFRLLNKPTTIALTLGRMPKSTRATTAKAKQQQQQQNDTLRATESAQSQSPAVKLKRKHVYDSLEHCRAVRSKTESQSKDKDKEEASTAHAEDESGTLDFVETLRSKSTSRSGRFHDTSLDGKSTNFKITSWNINGLRSWLSKRSGLTFIAQDDADVYCFQEIKCGNSKIPSEIKSVPGYNCYWNGSDDGQSGVVCFSKQEPKKISNGIGIEMYDKEARVITLEFEQFYVVNVYVPNSGRGLVRLEFRMKWDADFQNYLSQLDSQKPVIVCGDLNVSHQEIDLANPKSNLKTAGFTIGERNNFSKLLENVEFLDVFRFLNPDKAECYTFWTYMRNAREKNVGWRLDYFLVSKRWTKKICDCIIRNDVYGSDHCPVSLYLAI